MDTVNPHKSRFRACRIVTRTRAAADLAATGYLPERSGLRQRVPLFDAPQLRDFLSSPSRRLFLAGLLASFTRVASGRYRVRSGGRTRTRRFSELDPVRLAALLDAVPQDSRPGVYRRLGDVSLFLAGVFPDYAAAGAFGPAGTERLLRLARVPAPDRGSMAAPAARGSPPPADPPGHSTARVRPRGPPARRRPGPRNGRRTSGVLPGQAPRPGEAAAAGGDVGRPAVLAWKAAQALTFPRIETRESRPAGTAPGRPPKAWALSPRICPCTITRFT